MKILKKEEILNVKTLRRSSLIQDFIKTISELDVNAGAIITKKEWPLKTFPAMLNQYKDFKGKIKISAKKLFDGSGWLIVRVK